MIKRETFESNAKECIEIVKKYDIKYISFWENMVREIVFHPTKKDCLTFEIKTDTIDDWSRSLTIYGEDLIKIAEEFNLPEIIDAPSMYTTDGLANVIHSNPLTEDWEFEEMRMQIPIRRKYL